MQGAKAGKKVAIIEKLLAQWAAVAFISARLPSKSFRESVYRWSLGSKRDAGAGA